MTKKKENTALNILMILFDHSSEQNPLKQKDLMRLIEEHYNYKTDRQTIRRGLDDLIKSDFPIVYKSVKKAGNQNYITDIWFEQNALLLHAGSRIEEPMEPPGKACLECAYFDDGSCSSFDKASICCPYVEAEEGD